jgi:hypothetical protein
VPSLASRLPTAATTTVLRTAMSPINVIVFGASHKGILLALQFHHGFRAVSRAV